MYACIQTPKQLMTEPVFAWQYQVGQLFSVAEASKNETGGGDGIQVLKNEPYEKDGEKGQFTHKVYHIKRYVVALHNPTFSSSVVIAARCQAVAAFSHLYMCLNASIYC